MSPLNYSEVCNYVLYLRNLLSTDHDYVLLKLAYYVRWKKKVKINIMFLPTSISLPPNTKMKNIDCTILVLKKSLFIFFFEGQEKPGPCWSGGQREENIINPSALIFAAIVCLLSVPSAAFLVSRGFKINTVLTNLAEKVGKARQVTGDSGSIFLHPYVYWY